MKWETFINLIDILIPINRREPFEVEPLRLLASLSTLEGSTCSRSPNVVEKRFSCLNVLKQWVLLRYFTAISCWPLMEAVFYEISVCRICSGRFQYDDLLRWNYVWHIAFACLLLNTIYNWRRPVDIRVLIMIPLVSPDHNQF